MADDDDEALRLNTLHRFRKHSPRLLLEEYSHCEVPAGCGGVVLRWIEPTAGTPASVRVFADGQVSAWVNGVESSSSRMDLLPGTNLLALACADVKAPESGGIGTALARAFGRGSAGPPLMVAILRALGRDTVSGPDAVVLLASGRGAPSWRATDREPAPEWTRADFDDSSWQPLARTSVSAKQRESHRVQQLLELGAEPLGLPGTRAWVRVRFEVPPLQTRDSRGSHA